MQQKHSPLKPKVFQSDIDEEYFEAYSKDTHLAIDCEMMGLNPRRDRLCLIQICDSSNRFSLIQILPDQKQAPLLKKLFENPDIVKIFHFARMDMLFLKTYLGIQVNKVFCTKIASKLARTYTDKHGLKELIREFFDVNIDKKNQSSDWGKKVLTKDQLEYATEDVRYLISLEHQLTEILIRENRYEIASKCFQFLPTLIDLDFLELKDVLEH
ncbi:MAG TPA: ribonuclease D [Leptospiraceae bacterium]|nr:ribonuclease D [Leptospiraceae bacterium]HMX35592.1 ribonuclease D [Leptospiraceae bacterium]HMY34407.1 ribonuclease D [Leptospiraceae bacterium]HMZ65558.1 ribonuclease D [Leptospiraceae bacterium]HNA09566.1 ribonuclease D [Leptospiraceae bacterium]